MKNCRTLRIVLTAHSITLTPNEGGSELPVTPFDGSTADGIDVDILLLNPGNYAAVK